MPHVTVRLYDRGLHTKIALNPSLTAGEAYMDGTLTIEKGSLRDFIEIATRNFDSVYDSPVHRIGRIVGFGIRLLQQYNPADRLSKNVAHHYDLSGTLYDLFLHHERQCSCAYFAKPDDSLETAHLA